MTRTQTSVLAGSAVALLVLALLPLVCDLDRTLVLTGTACWITALALALGAFLIAAACALEADAFARGWRAGRTAATRSARMYRSAPPALPPAVVALAELHAAADVARRRALAEIHQTTKQLTAIAKGRTR